MKLRKIQEKRNKIQKRGKIEMRRKNRKPIASIKKLPQFTTMNVIDGQAGLENYSRLIFYSLTIDNILNIIVLLILAGVTIATLTGENGILGRATQAKEGTELSDEKEKVELSVAGALANENGDKITRDILNKELASYIGTEGTDYTLSESETKELIYEILNPIGYNLMVTPKEEDFVIEKLAKVISNGLNNALHQKQSE